MSAAEPEDLMEIVIERYRADPSFEVTDYGRKNGFVRTVVKKDGHMQLSYSRPRVRA